MYYSAMVSNNISSRSKKNVSYSVKLTKNELKELEKAKKLFLSIKDKYKLTSNDLKELLEEVSFPEALDGYIKTNLNMGAVDLLSNLKHDIAEIITRIAEVGVVEEGFDVDHKQLITQNHIERAYYEFIKCAYHNMPVKYK